MLGEMIVCGDALEEMRKMESESVDALLTDPPAGIAFMSKKWDSDRGGRNEWVAWLSEILKECLRVMKPGAHGLVWAIPRTSHWTATALEDAGFEVREKIYHLFGSGFPKSHNISKAIDKMNGDERPVIGSRIAPDIRGGNYIGYNGMHSINITTAASAAWDGWGSALKPAAEEWIMIRKPLEKNLSIAENVLKHGVGGINIDASRIPGKLEGDPNRFSKAYSMGDGNEGWKRPSHDKYTPPVVRNEGRFPSNAIFSHNPDCVEVGTKNVGAGKFKGPNARPRNNGLGLGNETIRSGASGAPDNYGTETVSAWECTPGCPVAMLDAQSGTLKSGAHNGLMGKLGYHGSTNGMHSVREPDTGGASRFFKCFEPSRFAYVAKPSRRERNAGCEALPEKDAPASARSNPAPGREPALGAPRSNHHPTVKSLKLMKYLATLITPPGGLILDSFFGSGSTGVAALHAGFRIIGIEREREYYEIAKARLAHALKELAFEDEFALESPEQAANISAHCHARGE